MDIKDNYFYKYYETEKWDISSISRTVDVADHFSTWYWYTMTYKDDKGVHIIKSLNYGYTSYSINNKNIDLEESLSGKMEEYANYLIEYNESRTEKKLSQEKETYNKKQKKLNEFVKKMLGI